MAWFLFIDESGQDRKESPYEVLAGVAVEDDKLWSLIQELHSAEMAHFGRRYSDGARELKGKKILKRKVFSRAQINLNAPLLPNEVPALAKEILVAGGVHSSPRHQKALALAKIAYVTDVFSICTNYGCKIFASIVEPDAPKPLAMVCVKITGTYFSGSFISLRIAQMTNKVFWLLMSWKNQKAIS